MSITVSVYVEEQAIYDRIKLYRDTSPTGAFSTLVDTVSLVAGQEVYNCEDGNGTANSWYRYLLSDGSIDTPLSEAFRPSALTLLTIRLEAAMRCGAGFASTCSATGASTYLVDVALGDVAVDTKWGEGGWIYRPTADADDRLRRVAKDGLNTSNWRLTPTRAWSDAPAEDEAYHFFLLLSPVDTAGQSYSWDRAVRDGLRATWYTDLLNCGEGDGRKTLWDLDEFGGYLERDHVRMVYRRTESVQGDETVYTYRDARKQGGWTRWRENGPGSLQLEVHPPLFPSETLVIEANRRYETLYSDDDVTNCPLELASRAAAWQAYAHLNRISAGRYATEEKLAHDEFMDEYLVSPPRSVVNGV